MTPQSAKAKGRLLQQAVASSLLERIYIPAGLQPDDCKSTGMGQNGVDIQLSPAARGVCDVAVEAKNQQSLNVTATFWKHWKKYIQSAALKILVSKRNHTEPLVTMRLCDFMNLLEDHVSRNRDRAGANRSPAK